MKIIENKKVFFAISLVIIIVGLSLAAIRGFNYGIDFTGGTVIQIEMDEYIPTEEIREIVDGYDPGATINHIGDQREIIQIRTTESFNNETRVSLYNEFKEKYSLDDSDRLSSGQYGPQIGAEIRNKAVISIIIATIGMLLYITFRFQFSYGISAIVALIHDVLVVLAVYSIFRIPVNSPFVAAMLTVVGYSINDTIVVFDRIRENLKTAKRNAFAETAELSIKQTVRRSLNTSFTTILAITALYILGVDSIKEFTLPLLAGILTGTYSSIFIASPVWVLIKSKKGNI